MLKFGVISLFPDMFKAYSEYGVTGKAVTNNLVSLKTYDPYDYLENPKLRVDDKPYGGGAGMILRAPPLKNALDAAKHDIENSHVIALNPIGERFDQNKAQKLINLNKNLIIICGRYEGIDARITDNFVDENISVGDYIVTGGELPAMIIMDAITRLLPKVLGDETSALNESFDKTGLLDYPQYTRPEKFEEFAVPEVLLSGNHDRIDKFRLKQRLGKTFLVRPDIIKNKPLNDIELSLLNEYISEQK